MQPSKCSSFLVGIFLSLALILSGQAKAGDIEAKLPDSDDTSAFQVTNADDDVLLTVQSGGKVGIGTPDPQSALNILGGAWNLFDTEGDFKIGGPTNRLKMGIARGGMGAGTANILAQGNVNTLNLGSGKKYVITIKNDRVGIGASNPIDKLEVEGSLAVDGGGELGVIRIRQDNALMWTFLTASWIGDDLRIRNETTGIDMMTFDNESNNVGIGTTNPSYKLHVNGTVAGTGWVSISSKEYKEDIRKVDEAAYPTMLAKLKDINLSTYRYKKEYGGDDERKLGFIAEDMPDEVLSQDGKGVDIYELLALTIGSLKAQQKENERLKVKLEEIRAHLETLDK